MRASREASDAMAPAAGWTFVPERPGRMIRDSKGDFFQNDAVEEPGQALVREAIQNALDARRPDLPGEEPVRVAFRFVGPQPTAGGPLRLDELRPHLTAERNGLAADVDVEAAPSWLIVEDEGTVGLTGDPTLTRQPAEDRTDEHFYHFVWAEGQTNKGEGARGSHGVGKMVFSLASTAHTTLVHTRRISDGRELLIGRCHLRHHQIGGDYCDSGFFGRPDDDRFTHPLDAGSERAVVEAVRESVGFAPRGPERTGLSIAILWPDSEIVPRAIADAVCREWFESILSGRLVVTIEAAASDGAEASGGPTTIDAGTFEAIAAEGDHSRELAAAIGLARHRHETAPVRLRATDATRSSAWKWHAAREQGLLDGAESVRQDYLDGQPIHVRIPVRVPKKGGAKSASAAEAACEGSFDVVLQKVVQKLPASSGPHASLRPWYLREGIHISDVTGDGAKRSAAYRAIVAIDGGPVAAMLRAAENPAHTQWLKPKLKNAYARGCLTCLEFVKSAAESLHQAFVASDEERDVFALADFFGVAGEGLRDRSREKANDEPTDEPDKPPTVEPIVSSPKLLEIDKVLVDGRGGVKLRATRLLAEAAAPGETVEIEVAVAYDVNRGDAMRRHALADFDLRELGGRADPQAPHLGLKSTARGGQVRLDPIGPNRLQLRIAEPATFERFLLTGFDPLRDLKVTAKIVSGLRRPEPDADDSDADAADAAGDGSGAGVPPDVRPASQPRSRPELVAMTGSAR